MLFSFAVTDGLDPSRHPFAVFSAVADPGGEAARKVARSHSVR
jgi:hypothetical protein